MAEWIGKAGLELIQQWEGCRLQAYMDAVGVWTIGYGHTGTVEGKPIQAGMTITQAQAEQLLLEDIAYFSLAVGNVYYVPFTVQLNQNQRDALISFAFNCGVGSLKQLCRNRTPDQIPEHITAYVHGVNGIYLSGLANRREAEKALYLHPVEDVNISKWEESKMRYQYVTDIPNHHGFQDVIRLLMAADILFGDGTDSAKEKNLIDLSYDQVRLLVLAYRGGAFDRKLLAMGFSPAVEPILG